MDELKQFIKESVESVVQNIIPVEFHTLRESINDSIERAVSGIESRVSEAESRLETVEKENVNITKTIDDLQQKTAVMENNIKKALIHCNNNEQYSRRESVRIYGLPLPSVDISGRKPVDNCQDLMIRIAKESLGIDLSPNDVVAAHRVGKVKNNLQPVIVKFQSRKVRDKVIMKRKLLKGSAVSIHEDLTKLNVSLLNRLDSSPGISKSWSWMGKIWAIAKGSNAKKVRVELYEDSGSIVQRSLAN